MIIIMIIVIILSLWRLLAARADPGALRDGALRRPQGVRAAIARPSACY